MYQGSRVLLSNLKTNIHLELFRLESFYPISIYLVILNSLIMFNYHVVSSASKNGWPIEGALQIDKFEFKLQSNHF